MHIHQDQDFRDETNLIRLLEHLDYAIEDVRTVRSARALENNRVLLNSVAMEMTQVQECARWLSDAFHDARPDLPWKELRALRNVLVHEYDEIDVVALYGTVTVDAPRLAASLRPIVSSQDRKSVV